MKNAAFRHVPGALSLLERAVFILRRNSSVALAEYYLGSLPFVLALLYFWSDMSRNPFAARYNGPAALGLAVLFVWMKVWHVRYCRRLYHALQGTEPSTWSWQRVLSVAGRQTAVHASAVLLVPLAALLAFPSAWVYAFYQNACVLENPRTRSTRDLVRRAMDQSMLWPGQNHLLLGIGALFGIVVLLNLRVGLSVLPYLVKWLFGVETIFTLSGAHLLNTTYMAVLGAMTYLCVDPVIKAAYVLRCFFGAARFSGDDLRADLRPFLQTTLFVLLVLATALPAAGGRLLRQDGTTGLATAADSGISVRELDRAIEATLKQRRFAWRMPETGDEPETTEKGWLAQTLTWLYDFSRPVFKTIGGWIERLFDWLKRLLPDPDVSTAGRRTDWSQSIRTIAFLVVAALVCLLIFGLVRWWRQRRAKTVPQPEVDVRPAVDIDDHLLTADDLPVDGWIELAEDLIAQRSYRKALRALYLSILAALADQERVVIARYKSNREYISELAGRTHGEPGLLNAFQRCVHHFERSWYGLHPATRQQIEHFKQVRERITRGHQFQS